MYSKCTNRGTPNPPHHLLLDVFSNVAAPGGGN